ncbi:MAG: cupredoxin domain-containing protein [Acidobacteria bacterium]|jgi:heme/copper-type cytochrome/quinol oxidase subunit 2|nr:cupredoxin domain-containing protein [Acidobacteriota bacterium]
MSPQVLARRLFFLILPLVLAGAVAVSGTRPADAQEPTRHELLIKVKKYQFSQTRIEVAQGDVVKITLVAEDVPHSFTVDEYRIAKRASPGKPVTFEFRADRAGTFRFYCNLTSDDAGCKDTHGELIVSARRP